MNRAMGKLNSGMKIRKPAVAGRFYPATPAEISRQLSQVTEKEHPFIDLSLSQKKIFGAVLPHAGYMFSAYQAVHFFEIIKQCPRTFDTFFIISPNHTGYSPNVALDEHDYWETPFGNVETDKDFKALLHFPQSKEAHQYEHSGEVLVPMLQFFLPYAFKIVPITLLKQTTENAKALAQSILRANSVLKKKICILASSDFSHYVDPDKGKKQDQLVLDQIMNLNAQAVFDEVRSKNISVCGYGAIMTLMEYTRQITENAHVKILKRGHSGEIIPSAEVVDYISILFYAD